MSWMVPEMLAGGWAVAVDWLPESALPFLLLGLIVGLMVGLTSIGAGAVATPALIILLETPPLVAVSTAIVTGAATKAIGAWLHHREGTVDRKVVWHLVGGSLPGVALAVFILHTLRLRDTDLANIWVDRWLGLVLVVLGLCVLARDTKWVRRWQAGQDHPSLGRRSIVIGAVVGLLFGATSVGTGSLLVVLLSIFLALPEARVVGSAVLYGFVVSLFAALLHIFWGAVSWPLVGLLWLGSIPGVVLGSQLAARVPHRFLRVCLSLGAVWAGLKLL